MRDILLFLSLFRLNKNKLTHSIFIADRQELIREGVRSIINTQDNFNVVGEASKAEELLNSDLAKASDLLIYDYHGGSEFTIEDLQEFVSNTSDVNVLVISSNLSVTNLSRIMEIGVHGILTKTCDREEILQAVGSCLKGEKFFCNKVLDILMQRDQQEGYDCDFTKLTNREIDVVKLICDGDTTAEMAEKLSLSVHTVNTHRKNILSKLKIKSTAELMRNAISAYIVTLPDSQYD